MSFRPTICVVLDGEFIDFCYMRDSSYTELLTTCFRIYKNFSDCKTVEEYNAKDIAIQKKTNPKYIPPSEDNRDEVITYLSYMSEMPMVVDITNKCIYCSFTPLSLDTLHTMPDARDMRSKLTYRTSFRKNQLGNFMRSCVFWLDGFDIKQLFTVGSRHINC